MIIGDCPNCYKKDIDVITDEIPDYFTCNCSNCGSLLLYDNEVISDFHKTLHEECNSWPEDGKNVQSIDL